MAARKPVPGTPASCAECGWLMVVPSEDDAVRALQEHSDEDHGGRVVVPSKGGTKGAPAALFAEDDGSAPLKELVKRGRVRRGA